MTRVRFAPSPTGPLHIGGVRTALYNYLFAQKTGGQFLLRIEDTDQTRFVPGAEQYIIESLQWCGIVFDEGVHIGGPCGPYRQSDRKEIYKKYIDILLEGGMAYYAFETAEELEILRKNAEAEKKTFQYDCTNRHLLRNSLSMTKSETDALLAAGAHYVIRLKVPAGEVVEMNDLIRGHISVNTENIDDKVLFKSDGMPTYHLANIVDDHLMEITHVIRGEEWLPSLPLHTLLYRFFEWEAPQFAHLPLLLKPEGNGKLSKRDGDRLGFPVFPLEWHDPKSGEISSGYREKGYLPQAFINMLALLGWNPGTEQEIMNIEEMAQMFSLERVSKSGAKFDPVKAKWFNHQYIQAAGEQELAEILSRQLNDENIENDIQTAAKVIKLIKDRIDLLPDMIGEARYFFTAPSSYDEAAVAKFGTPDTSRWLKDVADRFSLSAEWNTAGIDEILGMYVKENSLPAGKVYNAIRLSLVGASKGPHLGDIMQLIGKEESIGRLVKAASTVFQL